MPYEHKEGSASLFKNDKKGNQNAPDWKGDGLLNGKKVKIAAWEKSGAKGMFFSMKIEEDNYRPTSQPEPKKTYSQPPEDLDSGDIPFSPLKKTQIASW